MKPGLILLALAAIAYTANAQRIVRIQPIPVTTHSPDTPVPDPDPGFPLHVHIGAARWGGPSPSYHGYGTGNLLGDPMQGFDFVYGCDVPFVENRQFDAFYQARWKKQGESLEILMQRIGTDHEDLCELKIAYKAVPFTSVNGARLENGSPTLRSSVMDWQPDVAYLDPDPDYPVRLHVLMDYWRYDGAAHGYGSANLLDDPATGLDYTYDCGFGFLPNTQVQEVYQGRWIKPGAKLEILLQRMGSDKVDRCELNVTLKNTPYADDSAVTPASAPATAQP